MHKRYIVFMFRRMALYDTSASDEASEDLMLQGEFKRPRRASTCSALVYGVCAYFVYIIEGPNLPSFNILGSVSFTNE